MFIGFAVSAILAGTVADQTQPEPAGKKTETNEIIVTGERVPRALRDTPSSVVVLTEDSLEASGADRLDQLLAAIPNIQPGSGEEGPAIRGQDSTGVLRNLFAFLGGARPRVTLQVDGRPISYYEYVSGSAPIWDVDRIEIFRSPQTTTQGRNSIAGAMFIETNDPGFVWEGRGRAIAGDFRTRQFSALVSGPLVEDQLAVRFSGELRASRMASDMADGIAGADIDRDDYGVARVKLLFTPKALPQVRLETSYVHTQSQAPQFEAVAAPFRDRRFPTFERTNGVMRVNVDSFTARVRAELGSKLTATLTGSLGDADARRFALPGLGLTRVDNKDRSAEAILRWRPPRTFELLAGIHVLATRQKQFIDITGLAIGKGGFVDRQSSLGLFGEVSWRPLPPLTVTAGLRHQRDHQDRFGQVGTGARPIKLDYDERFSAWLPKLSLAYKLSNAVTAGLLIQRAYNPGGTSVSLSRRSEDRFEPEKLRNIEAFFRGSLAGGRGSFAANIFHNDIKDAQRQLTVRVEVPGGGAIFPTEFANAPAARTYGLEAELGWHFGDKLSLRGGIGVLRTRLRETIVATDKTRGNEFQRSPRFSAVATADWRPAAAWQLSAQIRHHGDYFSDDANDPLRRIDKATIVDLRAAWTRGPATVFGYARNALNAFEMTYLFNSAFGTASDPRELGIGIETRF